MVNEDYTYFELTARDEFIINSRIIGTCWIVNAFFTIFSLFYGVHGFIFITIQCVDTILLIYILININTKNGLDKKIIVDEDGIFLKEWYSKKEYRLKWYQIKSVQIQNKSTSESGWVLTIHTHNDKMCFMFSPFYWYAKPKKCIKVLENCVDVKAKLKIGKQKETDMIYSIINIGLVDSILFDNGACIAYVYSMTGEKLRVIHVTPQSSISGPTPSDRQETQNP